MTNTQTIEPPTIGHMKALGLAGAWVTCTRAGCGRDVAISFYELGLPDGLPFPQIGVRRRFACSACGPKAVSVTPDWRDYRARGVGKPYP